MYIVFSKLKTLYVEFLCEWCYLVEVDWIINVNLYCGVICMAQPIKPGTDNKPAGTYHEVGPRGGNLSNGRTVHIQKGDRLPPTQKSGNKWSKN